MATNNVTPRNDSGYGIEKKKMLDSVLAQIEKNCGKGAVMRLGDGPIASVDVVPSGSLSLDLALGIGGLPRGRIVEVYGPEGVGKTTLLLGVLASGQSSGLCGAIIDAEHALDLTYAKKLGVDVANLLISQPDSGEQALSIVDMLVRSGAVDMIVVDSVAALTPRAEIDGEIGDSHMGLQARLMSHALRKLASTVCKSGVLLMFSNQMRMKIGPAAMFGNPETTTGGNALKFYSSIRLDVRKIGVIKKGDVMIGNSVRIKVVKNKLSPPFRVAEFEMPYGYGASLDGEILDIGSKLGIINKSGAWYSYMDVKLGQGRDAARDFLKSNTTLQKEIELKIRSHATDIESLHDEEKDSEELEDTLA